MFKRKIERHSNNEGSVVKLDMYGCSIDLFVADAKYRSTAMWGLNDVDLPELDYFTCDKPHVSRDYDSDQSPAKIMDACLSPLDYNLTDRELQERFPCFKNDKPAKVNTDILIRYIGSEAAHNCRNQNIPEIGRCDLPNIYELMVLYLESDRLDDLDPTLKRHERFGLTEYCRFALGTLGSTHCRFEFKECLANWSSTVADLKHAISLYYFGGLDYDHKSVINGVIPVKELNII